MASQLARLSLPSFCSATTRITGPAPLRATAARVRAAASAGEPPIITVCFDFCGTESATTFRRDATGGRRRDVANLLLLGRHDALQRGVAQLVDAALDGQQRRQRHRDVLEPAAFELALRRAGVPSADLHLHDDRRVRHAEPLGQHRPELRVALVVGLQPGEDQVEPLLAHRVGDGGAAAAAIGARQGVVLDVDGAVGAAGQRLADHLLHAGRAGRDRPPPRRRASPAGAGPLRARRRRARSSRS